MRNYYLNQNLYKNIFNLCIGQAIRNQHLNQNVYENFFNVANAAANVARLNFDVSSEGTYHYTVTL